MPNREPFEELTDENFYVWAARHYRNRQCLGIEEFHEDLARFKHLKRLLRKYVQTGELRERLVLNHLVVIHNVFGIEAGRKMLLHRMEPELWPAMKTAMVYLNYLPESEMIGVSIDQKFADVLRKI